MSPAPRKGRSRRGVSEPPPPTGRRGRPPLIQDAMLDEMRRRIVDGELRPGERVPVRIELQQRFGASSITVQRMVDRLVTDGLVEVRGPQGTYVAERPPHLHRIALIFPFGPDAQGRWLGYYAAIERAAANLRAAGVDLQTVHAQMYRGWTSEFVRLQEECRHRLVSGLIFASPPDLWSGTPVCESPLPRISLTTTTMPGTLVLEVEGGGFMRRAVELVAQRGCRRPAVIGSSQGIDLDRGREQWLAAFAAVGIAAREQWLVGTDLASPITAAGIARLLCAPWSGERPDAIIIADDNFEEPALQGLAAEKIRAGDDLLVIAHANFPSGTAPSQPVLRIGYDTAAMLRAALARIAVMRAGGVPEPYVQPATFPDGT